MPGSSLPWEGTSDRELIQAIGCGCEESFRVLFKRWAPRLGPFLSRATGSREVAEDLLQEAFLRIIRAAPRFDGRGDAGSWIYRICANLAYSHWRRQRRSPIQNADIDRCTADPRANPEATRIRGLFARDVNSAVAGLPENQRLVFLLKIDRGLTYEQIADVLGCPPGTAKSRFHHASLKLRDALRDWREPIGGVADARRTGHGGTA